MKLLTVTKYQKIIPLVYKTKTDVTWNNTNVQYGQNAGVSSKTGNQLNVLHKTNVSSANFLSNTFSIFIHFPVVFPDEMCLY